jgi:hypothetical protein
MNYGDCVTPSASEAAPSILSKACLARRAGATQTHIAATVIDANASASPEVAIFFGAADYLISTCVLVVAVFAPYLMTPSSVARPGESGIGPDRITQTQ